MNAVEFSFVFFTLAPLTSGFGRLADISFSLCWMSRNNALERQSGNILLNGTSVASIMKLDKVASLTVHPGVENRLTLKYGNATNAWTITIAPSKRFNKIQGLPPPQKDATIYTRRILDSLAPSDVFACENNTVFFYQDEEFFLATGHTLRLPLRLESRTTSMLLLSWAVNGEVAADSHTVTLYRADPDRFTAIGVDSTADDRYDFTSLQSCSLYVVCVEIAATRTFTCLPAITDPDVPQDLNVSSWNSSSVSLTWGHENSRLSLFLLTIFYLNGTDQVTEEVCFWLKDHVSSFTWSDVQPCTRVRFGLQSVCQSGVESRYSDMVMNDGNSVHSRIQALRQTSFGPDNYTLEWVVGNASSISKFRVFHDGVVQGVTLLTNYSVEGLSPCQRYQARVEALCGADVVMSVKSIRAHTGPRGVSELRYRSNDSTVLWTPSTAHQSAVAFLYELSLKNGTPIRSSRVTDTELQLPGLDEGKSYVLDVWEECDGEWESEHTQLCFEGANATFGFLLRTAGSAQDLDMDLEFLSTGLPVVVPWSLPEDAHNDQSQSRQLMEKIFKDKIQELLSDSEQPVRVELVSLQPADEPNKTTAVLVAFDALTFEENVPLPVEEQLDFIHSLNETDFSVRDGVLYWDGPDMCPPVTPPLCPGNSLCINTLGSFTCVCKHGYYDVSRVVEPQVPSKLICNENGLFSHCLEKLMMGGIAKPYLTSYIGGEVEVRLNDGRCQVEESDLLYYFHTSRKSSECGTERRVNKTHFEYQNSLTVSLTKKQKISRRDLKVVWRCVYPRHYIRNAHVSMDMEWLSSLSFVQFNSSLQLGLTMSLYKDGSYNQSYTDVISLEQDDILYLQVALQTNNSFASDVLLQVESCWATESPDPQDPVQGVFLQDGCPIDQTFYWISVNGQGQSSRFSIEMFTLPKGLALYIHCLANICGHDRDCTKNCSVQQRTKRSMSPTDGKEERAAVVSAGPLLVHTRTQPSHWPERVNMIWIVAGAVGLLTAAVLTVSTAKAIMTYYERLQLQ